MKSKKKRIFFKILFVCFCLVVTIVVSFFIVFVKSTSGVSLDISKLESKVKENVVSIYDVNNTEINTDFLLNKKSVNIQELPKHVKDSFIAIEDKRFYKHNGVDYKRIFGAVIKNFKTKSFSQGASTISQQLIKNTHLSREKTINRKMKEIKLAYMLEKRFTKDEILEMYLNNIYFGNGCYGLENASKFYFGKNAKNLTVGESALLSASINAPSKFNPIVGKERTEERKKVVLLAMKNQGLISNDEYVKNAKVKENIVKTVQKRQNSNINYILKEAGSVLKINENQIKNMNLKIHTYFDVNLQNELNEAVSDVVLPKNNQGIKPCYGAIVIDNKNKCVVACSSSGINVFKNKRQPGSAIKPVIVYAPALEYNLIYPDSVIVDEKINIDGYSPANANGVFLGKVSVREALEKSLNVPAVKVLSKVGVKRAKNFSENLGLDFNKDDKNLALALGGMTDGLTLKQLADAYSTFATHGEFKSSKIIKKITDSFGNVLYEDKEKSVKVMKDSTACLITDLLKSVVKKGTARRLNSLSFDVAGKTGTVGLVSSSNNTDAYNIAYSVDYTVAVWVGSMSENEHMNSNVNGSTYPTIIAKNIFSKIYENRKPENFKIDDSVTYEYVDRNSFIEGEVKLASEDGLISDKKLLIFDKNNLPERTNIKKINFVLLDVNMEEGNKPTLIFETENCFSYRLYRRQVQNGKVDVIFSVDNQQKTQKHTDIDAKTGEIYEYFVKVCEKDDDNEKVSNYIKLMSF